MTHSISALTRQRNTLCLSELDYPHLDIASISDAEAREILVTAVDLAACVLGPTRTIRMLKEAWDALYARPDA